MPKNVPYFIVVGAVVLSLGACQTSPRRSGPSGMAQYGYPYVLGSLDLQTGQEGTITVPDHYTTGKSSGFMTITVPAGAFSVPVRIEVLSGKNSFWNSVVSPGQTVVANFAYRVTNLRNGSLIARFTVPITYSVTDPLISASSVFRATTASKHPNIINDNAASTISGDTLIHPTQSATFGWIITAPRTDLHVASGNN